jgi:pimeloyl-ACP methyl ester carboxylesterase
VHRFRVGSAWIGYCSNGDLDEARAEIRQVVIVVHGSRRNGCDYAEHVLAAARGVGMAGSTLVIAPVFAVDEGEVDGDPDGLRWSEQGWKQGDRAVAGASDSGDRVSSFDVVDRMVLAAMRSDRFPSVRRFTIVGHSAGGQFVQRFAATTEVDRDAATRETPFVFVVSNPSSYLYLTDRRPERGRMSAVDAEDCPDFDSYKYGLDDRNDYAGRLSRAEIISNYGARRVVYLLGGEDVDPDDPVLDTSCAAALQGETRLERGLDFYLGLRSVYGVEVFGTHTVTMVPGTGHDGREMLTSPEAAAAMFPLVQPG